MKNSFIIIIVFFAALQANAQDNRLGYHRSDGLYVTPQCYSFSEGYTYDSWYCNENTLAINRNFYNSYPKKKRIKAVYEQTYSRPLSTHHNYYPPKKHYDNSKYSIYYVISKSLNIYLGPSSNHKLIGTLNYGESVTVLDSYTNGWSKIQYLYYNESSSSFRTKTGYITGNYLSASKPNDNYDYDTYKPNNKSYNSNIYSYIEKAAPDNEVGGLTIWTNCATDREIEVFLDGEYVGVLKHAFTKGVPKCGESGTIFIEKEEGIYYLEAKGELYTWSGTITIVKNKCLIQGLER